MLVLYFLLSAFLCQHVQSRCCPEGWTTFKDNCYKFFGSRTTWMQAEHNCRNLSSSLVSLNDAQEDVFVKGYLKVYGDLGANIEVWIGANDMIVEGSYEWGESGIKLQFTDWLPGEPSGSGDCVSMRRIHQYRWTDSNCHEHRGYVCEKSANAGIANPTSVPKQRPCCPNGWTNFAGSCYVFVGTRENWQEAEEVCNTRGATLAAINFPQENIFLKQYLKVFQKEGSFISAWIGGNNLGGQKSFHWTTSANMTYTDWAPAQPIAVSRLHCVLMGITFHYAWTAEHCTTLHSFLCERPVEDSMVPVVG